MSTVTYQNQRLFQALAICLLVLCSGARVGAQEEITPDKRAAIKEMLIAMDAKGVSDGIFDALVTEYQKEVTDDIISDYKTWESYRAFTPEQKSRADKLVPEFYGKMFVRLKDLAKQEIGTTDDFELLAVPAYAKHFSESEIKELTAFYRSPIGRKFIAVVPAVSTDIMARFSELLKDRFEVKAQSIINEELRELQSQLNVDGAPPTVRTRTPVRRRSRK